MLILFSATAVRMYLGLFWDLFTKSPTSENPFNCTCRVCGADVTIGKTAAPEDWSGGFSHLDAPRHREQFPFFADMRARCDIPGERAARKAAQIGRRASGQAELPVLRGTIPNLLLRVVAFIISKGLALSWFDALCTKMFVAQCAGLGDEPSPAEITRLTRGVNRVSITNEILRQAEVRLQSLYAELGAALRDNVKLNIAFDEYVWLFQLLMMRQRWCACG